MYGCSKRTHVLAADLDATFLQRLLSILLLIALVLPQTLNQVIEGFFEPVVIMLMLVIFSVLPTSTDQLSQVEIPYMFAANGQRSNAGYCNSLRATDVGSARLGSSRMIQAASTVFRSAHGGILHQMLLSMLPNGAARVMWGIGVDDKRVVAGLRCCGLAPMLMVQKREREVGCFGGEGTERHFPPADTKTPRQTMMAKSYLLFAVV